MKKYFIIIAILLDFVNLNSQNLITNGGFENFSSCPSSVAQVNRAVPWYDPNNSSSDYYHACANSLGIGIGVPCQGLSCQYYQYPHSGLGYVALELFYHPGYNYREYIQQQLLNPLLPNKCYYVEYYTNHTNRSEYAINNIGAYISTTAVVSPYQLPYNLTPQILLPGNPVISDTINWTKVYGVYQATGGEDYLTIGNFQNDSNTTLQIIDSTLPPDAYYYIDDVSISEIPSGNAGNDTTICTNDTAQLGVNNYEGVGYEWQPTMGLSNAAIGNPTATPTHTTTYILTQTTPCSITTDTVTVTVCLDVGLNQLGIINEELGIYPNPSSGEFSIATKYKVLSVKIKNILGEEIKIINSTTFDLTDVSKGIYFAEVKTNKGIVNRKIIKE